MAPLQQHVGVLKSYKPDKGYGFFQSATVDSDVFLHERQWIEAGNPEIGALGQFEIEWSNRGKPQARNVEVRRKRDVVQEVIRLTKNVPGNRATVKKSIEIDGFPAQIDVVPTSRAAVLSQVSHTELAAEMTRLYLAFKDDELWALFQHIDDPRERAKTHSCSAEPSTDSGESASESGASDGVQSSSEAALAQMFHGKLKSYRPEKGFGFITCDDGRDVFLHKNQFDEVFDEANKHLCMEPVQFEITFNAKGQPQARNVKLVEQITPFEPAAVLEADGSDPIKILESPVKEQKAKMEAAEAKARAAEAAARLAQKSAEAEKIQLQAAEAERVLVKLLAGHEEATKAENEHQQLSAHNEFLGCEERCDVA